MSINITHLPSDKRLIRPLRQYEGYWLAVRVKEVIVIDLPKESLAGRYIQAIKKEKTKDNEYRHTGELRFSRVNLKLTVRFIRSIQ